MDINEIIARNLTAWMAEKPGLSTLKKVAARSAAGYGTIRRAKNGEGNLTVQNLELIASAFNKSVADLIRAPRYDDAQPADALLARETARVVPMSQSAPADQWSPILREVVALAERLPDMALVELRGMAKMLCEQYVAAPPAKPKKIVSLTLYRRLARLARRNSQNN